MLQLKKIDLGKAVGHECPGVKADVKTVYLAKIGGHWFASTFSREWFGLILDNWEGNSLQFDAPGTNSSDWQELYELVESTTKRRTMKKKSKSQNAKGKLSQNAVDAVVNALLGSSKSTNKSTGRRRRGV